MSYSSAFPPPASRPSSQPPSRSASRSNASSAWLFAGGAAALAAGALVAVWYWRRRLSAQPTTAAAVTSQADSGYGVEGAPPPQYSQRASELIDQLASTGDLTQLDVSQHRSYLHWIEQHCSGGADSRSVGVDASAADCIAVVKLFATVHTVRNILLAQSFDPSSAASIAALKEWEAEQADDLERAWRILHSNVVQTAASTSTSSSSSAAPSSAPSSSSNLSSTPAASVSAYASVPLLSLEIAQRLKRGDLLTSAYDRVMAAPPSSEESLIAAFMTAPLLGRWKDVVSLGQQLIAIKGAATMSEFHQASQEDSSFIDYSIIFDKSADWQRGVSNAPLLPPSQLHWSKYDVTRIRLQHDQSFSPDPQVNAMLQATAAAQKQPSIVKPPKGSFPLQVTGAIARMPSPAIIELPCVGRYSTDSISLYATAAVRQPDADTHATHSADDSGGITIVELSIQLTKQPSTQAAAAAAAETSSTTSRWRGHFQLREYVAITNGETAPQKGPLRLMHQFNLTLDTSASG